MILSFDRRDIYNADETGLFWKNDSDYTMETSFLNCSDKKASKERITAMICCSAEGEMVPNYYIGAYKKPRVFRGSVYNDYVSDRNHKGWMNGEIFSRWLAKFKAHVCERRVLPPWTTSGLTKPRSFLGTSLPSFYRRIQLR